jgi:hypothetical protein
LDLQPAMHLLSKALHQDCSGPGEKIANGSGECLHNGGPPVSQNQNLLTSLKRVSTQWKRVICVAVEEVGNNR